MIVSVKKKSLYNLDPLPDASSVSFGNYVGTLIAPSYTPQVIVLNYDAFDADHIIMRDKPGHEMEKIVH